MPPNSLKPNSLTVENLDEVDLLKELQKETEYKAPAPQKTTSNPQSDKVSGNQSDKSDNEETDTASQSDSQSDSQEPESDFEEPEDTEDVNTDPIDRKNFKLNGKKLAPVLVNAFDAVLSEGLPMLYEQTLDADDRLAMKQLARKYRTHKNQKTIALNEEDQRIMELFLDFEEYCESLPLDKEEKQSLIEPLAEWLGDITLVEKPEHILIAAVLGILFTRLLPVGSSYIANR